MHSFWSLTQARVVISDWKHDYNHHRRHSSLGYPPEPATLPPVPTHERLSPAVDQFSGSGLSRYGVRCLPHTTFAYTIHEAAATTGMWNPGTIRASAEIFNRPWHGASCPSPPSDAGRPTDTTSSSWPAPTGGCG